MANVFRWRYGHTSLVQLLVASDMDAELGDLVCGVSGYGWPISLTTKKGTDAAEARRAVRSTFAGVVMTSSPLGVQTQLRVATTGVFEFETDEKALAIGDLLGPAVVDGVPQSQRVVKVTDPEESIGRCAKTPLPLAGTVYVDLQNSVMQHRSRAS